MRKLGLFGGAVCVLHVGGDDYHPRLEEGRDNISHQLDSWGIHCVFLPKLSFTDRVLDADAREDDWQDMSVPPKQQLILRNADGADADGVLIRERSFAGGIANADCHLGVLYDEATRHFVVMHLGLACLASPMRSGNILQAAVQKLNVPPERLLLWIGFGICGECNGYNEDPDLSKMAWKKLDAAINQLRETQPETWMKTPEARVWAIRRQIPEEVVSSCIGATGVSYGPRVGQVSYNNAAIALHIARKLGITRIEVDGVCSASNNRINDQRHRAGRDTFWSNVYGDKQRNLAMAWRPGHC